MDTADLTEDEEANAYYKLRTFWSDIFLLKPQIIVTRYISKQEDPSTPQTCFVTQILGLKKQC